MGNSNLSGPLSSPEAPGESRSAPVSALKLLVKGFSAVEHQLLEATVRLSQRRTPPLALLDEASAHSANVVMVDTRDANAVRWANAQEWLQHKTVIWVDGDNIPPGHTAVKRPVQWPILPMILARALDNKGQPASPVVKENKSIAQAVSKNRRVLVVDDSLTVRSHLHSLLGARGVEVTEADNAEAGIAATSQTAYACILMDVLMPGIDGYEACRRIKAQNRAGGPAVIMLTSRSSPFDRIRGKMAGCDAYLTKPVDEKHLYEVLSNYVEISTRK